MHTLARKSRDAQEQGAAVERPSSGGGTQGGLRNGAHAPSVVAQRAMGERLNQSPKVQSQLQLQRSINQGPRVMALTSRVVQRVKIQNLESLRSELKSALDAGEEEAGSNERFLSSNPGNLAVLGKLLVPGPEDEASQEVNLKRSADNGYLQGRNDRVLARIKSGARQLMSSVLFWRADLQSRDNAETDVLSVSLMGSDLHEQGLGAAQVVYLREKGPGLFSRLKVMIKPEDRSIEDALIGSGDSLATRLNEHLGLSRQVSTVNMDVDAEHGTIMEYVESGLKEAATVVLRKLGVLYSSEATMMETIALAFLGGIWDLHKENVLVRGGKPVLIDADVALRPAEFQEGPDSQQGLDKGQNLTERIRGQLAGDQKKASVLLQYAIEHPEEIIQILREVVGDKKARIVPVFTGDLATAQAVYVHEMTDDKEAQAEQLVSNTAKAVATGMRGSKGLQGELGPDQGHLWSPKYAAKTMQDDFESGQLPYFTYQPSTGRAFYHGKAIWKGTTLDDSMEALAAMLKKGGQGKKQD